MTFDNLAQQNPQIVAELEELANAWNQVDAELTLPGKRKRTTRARAPKKAKS